MLVFENNLFKIISMVLSNGMLVNKDLMLKLHIMSWFVIVILYMKLANSKVLFEV